MRGQRSYRIRVGPAPSVRAPSPEARFLQLLKALQDEGLDFEIVADTSSPCHAAPHERHVTVDLAIGMRHESAGPADGGGVAVAVERALHRIRGSPDQRDTATDDLIVEPSHHARA